MKIEERNLNRIPANWSWRKSSEVNSITCFLTEHLETLVLGTWCPLLARKSTAHMWNIHTYAGKTIINIK